MERYSVTDGRDDSLDAINPSPPTAFRPNRQREYASRPDSSAGVMVTIPETREVDTSGVPQNDGDTSLLRGTPTRTSLVRKFTTYLKSPITRTLSSSHSITSPASFPSVRRSRGKQYASVEDEDDSDHFPIDISSLGGMGYELRDMTHQNERSWTAQDTAYVSPRSTTEAKPDFQSFVNKRRTIGEGMERQIRLGRNPSITPRDMPTRGNSYASGIASKTPSMKDIGRNIAQQRNRIVAVSEHVDLSVLEGQHMNAVQSDQTAPSPVLHRTGTVEDDPQSYFFPKDPKVPNWKPISMSIPYIMFLTVTALGLAGVQEFLCQWSYRKQAVNSGILAFNSVAEVSVWDFFVWKYLPTMITIIYAVLFSIMDFDIRRLEPYYQLSQPQGSTAAASLNLDHLTMFQYFVPFKALRLKQWAVGFSTIGNIVASTVAPALQNPSMNFMPNPDPQCSSLLNDPTLDSSNGCPDGQWLYFVRIDPVWSRLLSASYVVVALIAIVLSVQLRRKSGLLSDPKGIAGIASMATKSHILHDFKGTDLATRADIHKRLAHRRFVLYQSSIWQGEWSQHRDPIQESEKKLKSPHPPMLRLAAAIPFIGVMIFCLAMVPLISLTRQLNAIPNKLPWLPILVATILKLAWSTFESDVRLIEPFYQLSKGQALPENSLTLDYQATVYGVMPFIAAYNGHWLVCIVGICSVALDVLSVTVSSFSVNGPIFLLNARTDISNGDESSISFFASVILSMAILTFVIFTTCMVYARRRHPFLPREPSTIAAVLAFIYASKMLDDFIDTERYTSKEMEKKLKDTGKRYGLGWFYGRDGQVHCAIDEEPMKSRYVHGSRYDRAVAGPLADHGNFNYA